MINFCIPVSDYTSIVPACALRKVVVHVKIITTHAPKFE